MNLYNVLINNKIPFVLVESTEDNILYCSAFNDHLFNVGVFKTRTKDIILEYKEINQEKYVDVDLTFEDGECYKNVRFKVILSETAEDLPYCTFNPELLLNVKPAKVELFKESEYKDNLKEDRAKTDIVIQDEYKQIDTKKTQYDELVSTALETEKRLIKEQEKIKNDEILLQQQDVVTKKIDEVQQELLEKYFNATKEQEEILNTSINNNLNSLETKLIETLERYSDSLNKESDEIKVSIAEQFVELKEKSLSLIRENIEAQLDEYKPHLYEEFFEKAGRDIDEFLVKIVEEKVQNTNIGLGKKIKDEVSVEIKKYVDDSVQSARTYARRILELGGGGGTVAVQFARGGTMDGSLDVTGNVSILGNYLSGGRNLIDIFGSGESSSIVNTSSARWNSTYTTVNANSGTWATFDYVISNYLNLTGGRIDGDLTVNGSLTALGDSYFVNTVFTTTSALSVVNLGHGPALYVYQAPGQYDVASFYDGDGIEVLHVGNAQPNGLGKIGINTSYPDTELTVNGVISSNNIIFADGGNSNNWNSVYSSVSSVSSSWDSVYTSVELSSSNWDSVYTSVNNTSASWDSVYNFWHSSSGEYVTVPYLSTNNVLLSAATVTDDINVGGTGYFQHVAAATKSFYIKHPTKKNKHLQYGSLESPYHGVRLTGKNSIKTRCKVVLPDYISSLVAEDGVNIQITNINHTKTLYIVKVDIKNNCFIVGRTPNFLDKNKEYEFYWSFTAIRRDIPKLIVER